MPTTTPGASLPSEQMLPAARAALEQYAEDTQGDLSDVHGLADAVYRAAVDDTMQALRAFSGIEDHLYRAVRHYEEADKLLRGMHALWQSMDVEQ